MSDNLYNLLELGKSDNHKVHQQICRIFKLFMLGDDLSWTLDEGECHGRVTKQLAEKLRRGQLIATMCVTRHFDDGPKYLTMKAQEFEALENTDLTIPIAEYTQPFPVVCFPIPENYARDREVKMFDNIRIPKYAIIWHRADMILITIVYAKDFVWSTFIVSRFKGHDFETKFEEIVIGEHVSGSEADLNVIKRILRACLNGALIFDQVKTTSFTTRKGKKPHKTDAVYYSFDQSVRLYSREGGSHDSTGEGSAVRCHWRRGHWRLQAHGVGLGLRKRIRIAPVLVRRDLFSGDLSNTTVTMERADDSH